MFLLPKTHWEVRKAKSKGKGVFAKKDIPAGVVIGDYIGKVIHTDDEENYEKKYGFYCMYFHRNASIFPDPKDDGIHLINHSCAPNSWMYTYKGHTLYFSLRKIFKGEELTISYLIGPQDKECSPCDDICRCGSVVCTQTMHMPEKKYDEWRKYDDRLSKKTKREVVSVGKILPKLKDYPSIIPDDSLYTLFGAQDKKPEVYKDKTLPSQEELRKRIRETGKYIELKNLNLMILGISDGIIISTSSN